ncbi:acireductone synthase [Bacteriovorax sp. PP10]|uniref:Enolase-phosphatase E1 n=1 Tax=Bacteriovorax antarcticus TaxID=3088717 RepID=A0ABU5VQG6_9BACT|nr:acireductone synthase [Bacteriovorax sp. PP10]MEA9355288.1 acireductone synthase [Bacteriovorax sp. PP10]
MKYILTDVEGTTTSISFVHETLFPFAKERLKSFVAENLNNNDVQEILKQTKATAKAETQKDISDDEATDLLLHWIKTDRKHPALKDLQGLIWEGGYVSGQIKGHIYKDVPVALKAWKEAGLTLGVYSSGSVKAQHLIFEFSTEGNLRPYFSNHFDTAVGHKREVASYSNISNILKVEPSEILFLSDIKEELDAAREAGMQTIQLVRQNDVVIGDHKTARDFNEIKF